MPGLDRLARHQKALRVEPRDPERPTSDATRRSGPGWPLGFLYLLGILLLLWGWTQVIGPGAHREISYSAFKQHLAAGDAEIQSLCPLAKRLEFPGFGA